MHIMKVASIDTKRLIAATVAGHFLFISLLSYGPDWSFELEPYVMATTIEGDAGFGRVTGAPVDMGMDDILESLESAAMVHFEAHHQSGWGLCSGLWIYGFGLRCFQPPGRCGGCQGCRCRQATV